MDYTAYSTDDFLADESFQDFALGKDEAATRFWQEWLAENPSKAPEFQEAHRVLNQVAWRPRPVPEALKQAELTKLRQHLYATPALRLSRRRVRLLTPLAAVVVIACSLGLWRYFLPHSRSYTTSGQEQHQIQLPDGSRVILNGDSELRLNSTNWAAGQPREVWLQGEGFFVVQHTAPASQRVVATAPASAKFIVHAGAVDVAVLGTEFNVSSRAGHTNVVLRTGQIQLTRHQIGHTEQVVMRPGELVSTDSKQPQAPLTPRAVPADLYSAWTTGHLDFKDTPVADIVTLLHNSYGLQVTVRDSALLRQKLTGTVPNQDLDVLLNSLGKSLDVTMHRQGQHVRLD